MNLAEALQYLEDLEVSDSSGDRTSGYNKKFLFNHLLIQMEITVTLILVTKRTQVLII